MHKEIVINKNVKKKADKFGQDRSNDMSSEKLFGHK